MSWWPTEKDGLHYLWPGGKAKRFGVFSTFNIILCIYKYFGGLDQPSKRFMSKE